MGDGLPSFALDDHVEPEVPVLHAADDRGGVPDEFEEEVATDHRGEGDRSLVQEDGTVAEAAGPAARTEDQPGAPRRPIILEDRLASRAAGRSTFRRSVKNVTWHAGELFPA